MASPDSGVGMLLGLGAGPITTNIYTSLNTMYCGGEPELTVY